MMVRQDYIKVLNDGSSRIFFETWASGPYELLEEFRLWLWTGSPQSQVESVEVEEASDEDWDNFEIIASA